MEKVNITVYENKKFIVNQAMWRNDKKKNIFIVLKVPVSAYLHKDGRIYSSTHSEEGYTGWFKSLKKAKKAIQKHKELNK